MTTPTEREALAAEARRHAGRLREIATFLRGAQQALEADAAVECDQAARFLDRLAAHQPEQAVEAQAQEPIALTWYDGAPPFPQDQEWFIAETTYGDRVVLRSLDEGREHRGNYAFTTTDGTYLKAEVVARWMQFPDCAYIPPVTDAATHPAPKAAEPAPVEVWRGERKVTIYQGEHVLCMQGIEFVSDEPYTLETAQAAMDWLYGAAEPVALDRLKSMWASSLLFAQKVGGGPRTVDECRQYVDELFENGTLQGFAAPVEQAAQPTSQHTRDIMRSLRRKAARRKRHIRELQAALSKMTKAKPAVPPGWQLVPVKPTPEMMHAGEMANAGFASGIVIPPNIGQRYSAMLAAAPQCGAGCYCLTQCGDSYAHESDSEGGEV
jgi:hypothetical protein